MASGFLSGFLVGGVLAVGGVAALSLLTPLPEAPDVGKAPEVAVVPVPAPDAPTAPAADDEAAVSAAPASRPGAADEPAEEAGSGIDTRSAALPEAGTAAPEAPGGPAPETAGADAPRAEEAAAPRLQAQDMSAAPEVPSGSTSISTDPAQPAPPPVEPGAGFGLETEAEPELVPITPAPEPNAVETAEAAPAPQRAGAEPAPQADTAVPDPVRADTGETGAPDAPAPAADVEAPRLADLPQAGAGSETTVAAAPGIGEPVRPLTERDDGPLAEAEPAAPPPLLRYAAPFEDPEGRPLMAIVLIDDAASFGAEALEDFPYPLTFAIDPALPDAAARMRARRQAGFEVVALAGLPDGATASDAEVALAAGLDILPETVAIMEAPGGGFHTDRALSDQVTQIAAASGRGLVTQDGGLNTAARLAQREGVPAAVVFRDFDGEGQTPAVMRRFLDQAAFRAGQEGAVIMMGRVRPDTISALLLWGLQDRASRVALAPVSAVLTAGIE